jgi:hypothetical protein
MNLMSEWVAVAWERKEDIADHLSGSCLQISCSMSPFYLGMRYAVRFSLNSIVLNRNGEWEREPIPSNRDVEFYDRCRFKSFEAAVKAAEVALRKGEVKER